MPGAALVFGRPLRGWVDALHTALLVPLIALRPLVWSGDGTGADSLAWQGLALAGLALVLAESLGGWRRAWRWGWSGALAALLALVLLPAAARSPQGAEGWGLWGMLVTHLGYAAYLMQAVPGRERVALAALAAGLVGECAVALLQLEWVFPAMRTALAAGDPTLVHLDGAHGDLEERLLNGGIYGTFTLANTLGGFLVLVGPAFAALAARATGWARRGALLLAGLAVATLALTASKGAWLALAAAAGLAACLLLRGRWRWLPPACALPLVALLVVRAPAGVVASAQVRLGYWQGAATLVGEAPLAGQGLRAFATHSPRAMPITAEPTRYVHCEPLEAAVDAGLPAGLLLIAMLAVLAMPRFPAAGTQVRGAHVSGTPHPCVEGATVGQDLLAALPLFLLTPTFAALGMLDSAFGWWPGGAAGAGWLAWALAMGALLGAVAVLAKRLPLPPAWAWRLGLGALALHCLVDFDLHSPAIWGTVAVVATLAAGAARSCAVTRPRLALATIAVIALGAGLGFGVHRSGELLAAEALLADLDEARGAVAAGRAQAGSDLAAMADDLGLALPPALRPEQALATLTAPLLARAGALAAPWPRSAALDLDLAQRTPPGAERLALSDALVAAQPASASAHLLHAGDLADAGRWDQALDEAAVVLRLSPAALTRRLRIAALYERAARALPSRAAELDAQATDERARIAALLTVVNPRNRP